ncbi:hypothetical protein [Nissabacter sp. SGAir0207]|uniref:hypothetical protein n=1 Tax=Nissabacter sp. SGAir0207 TaxID=2126321 RepID=UPI00143DB03E|nr:hypothetical protein [Nissabacter sp. SGAir0207]
MSLLSTDNANLLGMKRVKPAKTPGVKAVNGTSYVLCPLLSKKSVDNLVQDPVYSSDQAVKKSGPIGKCLLWAGKIPRQIMLLFPVCRHLPDLPK